MLEFLKKLNKKEQTEKYFGLCLRESGGIGMIIEVLRNQSRVVKKGEKAFSFSNGWEYVLEDIDDVLFELEKSSKQQMSQVLFFLYSHLIDQKSKVIKDPYRKKIAEIAKELELKPLGFIEYHEAISRYFQHVEEAPLTAIIVEIDTPSISIFIYRGGELFLGRSIARTENIIDDLNALFSEITDGSIMPARILLYDSKESIEDASAIVQYKWDPKLFVQIPKVEVLNDEQIERILLHAISYQLFDELPADSGPYSQTENIVDNNNQENVPEGFLIAEDVLKKRNEKREEIAEIKSPDSFVESQEEKKAVSFKENLNKAFTAFGSFTKSRFSALLLVIIGLLLVVISVFSFLYYFHQATLVLYMDSKKIQEDLSISADQKTEANAGVLKISVYTDKLNDKDTVPTTGKKVIGQKARGKITIINSQLREKTFKSGTIMISSSGVRFATREEIKVASASTSLTAEGNVLTITGKTDVSAEAEELGDQGNIAAGETLSVENFDKNQYFATVKESFAGGSRQEVSTVAKKDMDEVRKKILDKLKNQISGVQKEAVKNGKVIADLSEFEVTEENYSHEIGEESENLTLTLNADVKIYTYQTPQIRNIIAQMLKEEIPDQYELENEKISYNIRRASKRGQKINLELKVDAQALPLIEKTEVFQDVLGKSDKDIEALLKSKYKVKAYNLDIKTPLSMLQSRMPIFPKNIIIKVESLK